LAHQIRDQPSSGPQIGLDAEIKGRRVDAGRRDASTWDFVLGVVVAEVLRARFWGNVKDGVGRPGPVGFHHRHRGVLP